MGIKKNIFYSSFLTCSNYIFPLITYPYICRVLGVENIGKCNYIFGIVTYFLLFATMGTSVVGIREIAKNRDNQESLNKSFSSILLLNITCTIVTSIIYILFILLVPSLIEYRVLLIFGSMQLILTSFQIEWFYKGMENFKYITIRSLIIKIIYIVGLFIFCRRPDDYIIYFLLTIISFIGNAVFNWFYKGHFVHFTWHCFSLKKFSSSFFMIGIYTILAAMYTSFNVVYLGWVSSDAEVGYYTTAIKLFAIILSFYTAITGVLMPRISKLNKDGEINAIKRLNAATLDILIPTVLCIIIYSEIYANEIVYIIAGKGYENAVLSFRILLPILLFAGIEQIFNNQVLMPLGKDKLLFVCSLLGACVGITLNILLVNEWHSTGSSLVWVLSVLSTTVLSYIFVNKTIGNILSFRLLFKNLVGYTPLLLLLLCMHSLIPMFILNIAISAIVTFAYFITLQILLKNEAILPVINKLKFKWKK